MPGIFLFPLLLFFFVYSIRPVQLGTIERLEKYDR